MVLEYFSLRKKKPAEESDKTADDDGNKSPVLSNEDEKFLEKIASESAAPSNPSQPTIILDNGKKVKGTDAQVALMDGADKIPLPSSPPEGQETDSKGKAKNYLSYIPTLPNTADWKAPDWSPYIPSLPKGRSDKEKAGATLATAAEAIKSGSQPETSAEEEKKEQDDMSSVLDQLNLSARNNRVFSVTKDSQKLMEDFTLILKDIYNGVPTAYDDLDLFLTRKNKEITGMFKNMPPWLQTLVKSLPAKLGTSIAPEVMAAASEKEGFDAKQKRSLDPDAKVGSVPPELEAAGKKYGEKYAKKAKNKIPTLKSLVSQEGAVAGTLRSILNFLKLRFPAFITGTNVLMSVAVFLLLFVFWYCHKRGKETRLDKERTATEDAASTAAQDDDDDDAEESEDDNTDMEETTILQPEDKSADKDENSPLNQPDPKEVPLPEEKSEQQ